jgi:hypothetical protein
MIDGSVCFIYLSTQLDIQPNIQIQCSTYPGLLHADNIQYIKHTIILLHTTQKVFSAYVWYTNFIYSYRSLLKMCFYWAKNQHITLPALSMPLCFQQWRSRNIPSVLGVIILNKPSPKESDLNHEEYLYYTNSWTTCLFAHWYIIRY